MKRIYLGGGFPTLDIDDPEGSMKDDFRARVLGDVRQMLYTPKDGNMEVAFSDNMSYVGPYFFYDEGLCACQVVSVENDMINKCTDAVFLLENISSPGTVTELINAALLGKVVHIFYVSLGFGTPETEINSDQWYPIAFAQMVGKNVECIECNSREDAINRIISFVESISQ